MMVVEVSRCKGTFHEGIADSFGIGCRKMYPKWLLEQFDIIIDFKRHSLGRKCTATQCIKVQVGVTADLFDT